MVKNKIQKKSLGQKRIPTLVGVGILLIGLIAGTILFSQGTGVFAPRATPQTTPKKIKIANVTDASFTVSFLTDETTVGHVKYGVETNKQKNQASDDRDQLSGTVGEYKTHHITVRGLEANTNYFFTLGTGGGNFDNNGTAFTIKTTQRSGVPSAAKTIYGSVTTPQGSPADGAIIYVTSPSMGEMSSLVKSSGSWAIPLANARTKDGSAYAQITDEEVLTILAQGTSNELSSQITVQVNNAQPVSSITLGQSEDLTTAVAPSPSPAASPISLAQDEATPSAKTSGGLASLVKADQEILDLEKITAASESATITDNQPKIIGKAAPNVTISVQVNSDTQIDQFIVADENGNFEFDLAALEAELEPGEHTITYSYEDPETGETVTKTMTFYVEGEVDTSSQLALAETKKETPFSSASPVPTKEETSESKIATPAARTTPVATDSGLIEAGSVGTTYALILGGLFFIMAGVWSWWLANNLEEEVVV